MKFKSLPLLTLALFMTACATAPEPLYQWGGFPGHTYDTLRGEGKTPLEQVELMLAHGQQVEQQGKKLPPGFQAHLGLLYLKLGRGDQARERFEAELRAFPESKTYVETLLQAARKAGA